MKTQVKEIVKNCFEQGVKFNTTFVRRLPKASRELFTDKEMSEALAFHLELNKKAKAKRAAAAELATAKSLGVSVKKLQEMKAAANLACSEYRLGYSMGGVIKIVTRNKAGELVTLGEYDNRSHYAKTCTWKETHGYYELELPLSHAKQLNIEEFVNEYGRHRKRARVGEAEIVSNGREKRFFKLMY